MKRYLLITTMAVLFTLLSTQELSAQFWSPLIPLLEQWSVDELEYIGEETETLQNEFDFKSFDLREANEGLQYHLLNGNPTMDLGPLLEVFQYDQDRLRSALESLNAFDRFELGEPDVQEAIDQFDAVNEIWDENLPELGSALDDYGDDLEFDPDAIDTGYDKFEGSSGKWEQQFNSPLKVIVTNVHERYARGDKQGSGMERILDNLFDSSYDLELAFGTFTGERQFWWFNFPVQARAFRVATVPQFERIWETRWSVEAAYFGEPGMQESPELVDPERNFRPLMYTTSYAFMYNPVLAGGGNSGVSMRLYSSLGLELGTYAPGYVIPDLPSTFDNVGNTTGWGPQIGAGVVLNAGPLTFYSYGTMAHGAVHNAPDYRFTSKTVNAGLRLNKLLNVMYTNGYSNWGFGNKGEDNKYITYNRFTVGLILADLIRVRQGRGPR